MDDVANLLRTALGLGLGEEQINAVQIAARAVVVYVVNVFVVRLGKKRFMGRATAFDVVLGIMLGSIVSRPITGSAPFFPALVAAAVLVAMHWLVSFIAFHWHWFGAAFKGRSRLLVRDGAIDWHTMRRCHLSEKDLWEGLRDKGIARLEDVTEARLERSGDVSVIRKQSESRIINVRVAEGVQSIRIELG